MNDNNAQQHYMIYLKMLVGCRPCGYDGEQFVPLVESLWTCPTCGHVHDETLAVNAALHFLVPKNVDSDERGVTK